MNNYSSPLSIRILNKLDTIIGSLVMSLTIVAYTIVEGSSVQAHYKQVLFLGIALVIYMIICIAKTTSYISCAYKGYRISGLGLTTYIAWTLAVSVIAIGVLISGILAWNVT